MKSDLNIKLQIKKAIESNAQMDGATIEINVKNGEAYLSGYVNKFCKKGVVKKLAKEVEGVTKVNETIVVMLTDQDKVGDNELVATIAEKFIKNFGTAHTDIKVTVKDGYVWLDGQLKWKYQKDLAEECIACVDGVKWIENNIVVPESFVPGLNEKDILAAIYGDHSITSDIKVEILGQRVVIKGKVEDVNQKNLVTRLVRTVPGVTEIENFLSVDWMC
jgi:osmotically-inducible protein OsmY